MRYLIAETDWTTMALARDLQTSGIPLTCTDRPEDIPLYLAGVFPSLIVLPSTHATAREIMQASATDTPIAVAAPNPSSEDIARWIRAGADTVVDTNAHIEETKGRLLAVARRTLGFASPVVTHGPLTIDLQTRRAALNGCPLALAPKLYDVLECLALSPDRVVTREKLLGHVYGLDNEPDGRVFDVYITGLRKLLSSAKGVFRIETVRGQGFRFVSAVEPAAAAA